MTVRLIKSEESLCARGSEKPAANGPNAIQPLPPDFLIECSHENRPFLLPNRRTWPGDSRASLLQCLAAGWTEIPRRGDCPWFQPTRCSFMQHSNLCVFSRELRKNLAFPLRARCAGLRSRAPPPMMSPPSVSRPPSCVASAQWDLGRREPSPPASSTVPSSFGMETAIGGCPTARATRAR